MYYSNLSEKKCSLFAYNNCMPYLIIQLYIHILLWLIDNIIQHTYSIVLYNLIVFSIYVYSDNKKKTVLILDYRVL